MTKKRLIRKGGVRIPTLAIITKALNEAAQDAVDAHRKANLPLVAWKDGRIELISPDLIPPMPTPKRHQKTS